jgi:hypothetical protein
MFGYAFILSLGILTNQSFGNRMEFNNYTFRTGTELSYGSIFINELLEGNMPISNKNILETTDKIICSTGLRFGQSELGFRYTLYQSIDNDYNTISLKTINFTNELYWTLIVKGKI